MQIEHSIIFLWIICSMLACWAFSLIVRWYSDAHARKRDRLNAQYTPRSRWLAGALMFICVLGSALAGYSAAWISSRPNIGGVRLTPLGAIGIGMAMFACLLIVWGAIGDRSRGRMRCPRCWYDMRDSNGLPCPECGKEVHNEKHFNRTRRPRWAFVVALVFLILGGTGIGFNAKLRDQGWVGFIPNRVLTSHWERMPESWIHDIGMGSDVYHLSVRIRTGHVSKTIRRELAESLINEMILDPRARWEPRRMSLLLSCAFREQWDANLDVPGTSRPWVPENDQLQRLYATCVEDMLSFFQRSEVPMDTEHELRMSDALGLSRGSTLDTSRWWLIAHSFPTNSNAAFYRRDLDAEQVNYLSALLGDLPDAFIQRYDQSIYTRSDQQLAYEISGIELEIGVLRRRLPGLMTWYESNLDTENRILSSSIYKGFRTVHDDELNNMMDVVLRWLGDNDVRLRRSALNIINHTFSQRSDAPDHIGDLIDAIVTHALNDTRPVVQGDHSYIVADQALGTIGVIDRDGATYYPLLRDALLDQQTRDRLLNRSWVDLSRQRESRMLNWIEAFEPLIYEGPVEIRIWIARQIPNRQGSIHDERLNAMIKKLAEDPIEEVRDQAIIRAMDRGVP